MQKRNLRLDTALRQLVDRVPDVVFRYRLRPEPYVEYISEATSRLVGYTPDEYYADPELGFRTAHPDDRDRLAQIVANGDRTPAVLRWHRKDGSLIWAEQRLTPLRDESGELVAVDGVVREVPSPALEPGTDIRVIGNLRIDLLERHVTIEGKAIRLTPAEFKLLYLLAENAGHTVTRKQMMRQLWRSSHTGDGHTCEAHVSNLRKKIEADPRNPRRIVTVRGGGYRFSLEPSA